MKTQVVNKYTHLMLLFFLRDKKNICLDSPLIWSYEERTKKKKKKKKKKDAKKLWQKDSDLILQAP